LEGEQLVLHAATSGHAVGERLPLRDTLAGQAVQTRAPVLSDDVRTDPRFGRPDLAQTQGWARALVAPLSAAGESEQESARHVSVGAFTVYWAATATGHFAASDWDKKVLALLARYAALAVRNAADRAALAAAQRQRATAETFAAIGDVAANLLHRLNNKVGTIPVRVEGIEDKCPALLASNAYLAANLREIEQSARAAMDAVRQSLAFLQPMPPAPVAVADCVTEALAGSHLPAGIRVEVIGLAVLPPVLAHPRGLAMVFGNLLENAADALAGAGRIIVTGDAQREGVEVVVADDGPGIPPELHDRIFELNFSGQRKTRPDKLGFGLWWVRTLMTRLGGTITVESDGRHGASFRLRLPRAAA
jgi:signal transduction histidine kinase